MNWLEVLACPCVAVLGASFPIGALADTIVTVDIKANGSDGPVTLNTGNTYTYSWSSTNATSCELVLPSPIPSGISIEHPQCERIVSGTTIEDP